MFVFVVVVFLFTKEQETERNRNDVCAPPEVEIKCLQFLGAVVQDITPASTEQNAIGT